MSLGDCLSAGKAGGAQWTWNVECPPYVELLPTVHRRMSTGPGIHSSDHAAIDAFPAAAAEEAIPRMISAEREAARTGDLVTLGQLWAEEARIIDGRGTPDPADDYLWAGRDAVLDRYVVAVFPNPPPPLEELPRFDLNLVDDRATVHHQNDLDHRLRPRPTILLGRIRRRVEQ